MISYEFKEELRELLNRHSIENELDMPDFLMVEMLCGIIQAVGPPFKKTRTWYAPSDQQNKLIGYL